MNSLIGLFKKEEYHLTGKKVPLFQYGKRKVVQQNVQITVRSHTMKIFERILDNRTREIVEITMNQAGFVKNCGTTDAIYAAQLLIEKHREKQRPLYIAFLDLEKAFDSVPDEFIWYVLRQQLVPEELVRWVQLLQQN